MLKEDGFSDVLLLAISIIMVLIITIPPIITVLICTCVFQKVPEFVTRCVFQPGRQSLIHISKYFQVSILHTP